MKSIKARGLLIFTLTFSGSQLRAQDEGEVVHEKRLANLSTETDTLQKKVFLRTEMYSVTNGNTLITGTALAVGLYFARSEAMSIGPRFHQSYSAVDGWSTLYTALNFDFTWALTGSLKQVTTKHSLNGWEYMTFTQYNPGGIRARLSLDQYYYNTKKGSIPLSGFGVEGSYEFASSTDLSIEIGAGMDRISSPTATLTPMRIFLTFMDMF